MEKLEKMELLMKTQIRDEDVRELLGRMLEEDREKGRFDLGRYWDFYEYMGKLGKVQMDCWRVDETLGKFYGSLMVVRAAVKFKKNLRR